MGPLGTFNLDVAGSYYRLLTCTGPIEVRRSDGSVLGPINAGQGERETPFNKLTLVDKTGAANAGTILITDKNFVDDRITGEVSFVDGGMARSLAGKAFCGVSFCAAQAGLFSHCQIYNASTTKNVFLTQLTPSTSASYSVQAAVKSTPLATAYNFAANKKVGSPASSAIENRIETAAAYLGSAVNYLLLYQSGYSFVPYKLTEPILLPPGQGLVFAPQAVNAAMLLNFEAFEEVLP